MLKYIVLTTAFLLIATPMMAFGEIIEPTEYQLRNFDRRLEQYFDDPDLVPSSETYLRKSDEKRRTDGVVFCSVLAHYSVEDQLTGGIRINFRDAEGDEKKFTNDFAYTIGIATAAVDTLCTEYRSDFIDFSKKIQDSNFARSIVGASSVPAPSTAKKTDLFTQYMNRGYGAVREKNYGEALLLFKTALGERPNNPYALKAIENVTFYAQYSRWQLIGKTLTGETIFLDISSAHFVGYGEASEFDYKFVGKTTTRINKAGTESCDPRTGQIHKNTQPEWVVSNQDGRKVSITVKADSKVSIQMLNRVCRQSLLMFKKYGIQN